MGKLEAVKKRGAENEDTRSDAEKKLDAIHALFLAKQKAERDKKDADAAKLNDVREALSDMCALIEDSPTVAATDASGRLSKVHEAFVDYRDKKEELAAVAKEAGKKLRAATEKFEETIADSRQISMNV